VHVSQYFRGRTEEGLPPITLFLRAGCGFGGSCLPKDVNALIAHGQGVGQEMPLLRAVMRTNREQPARVVGLLQKHWPELRDVRVAVLGLSFKPGTNDGRESPAFPIIRALYDRGAVLSAYDPVAIAEARAALGDVPVNFCDSLGSAIDDADAVVVVTPWEQFRDVPAVLIGRTPQPVLVDCRRAFEPGCVDRYEGIGL
jgi:UDPglucose 6-dehydrogenase